MRLSLRAMLAAVFILCLMASNESVRATSDDMSFAVLNSNKGYSYQVIQNDTSAWIFTIYKDSKAIIAQNHIPAIQGLLAFQDSVQAANVAKLMIKKMEDGVFPPAIKISELDSLKIVY